MHISIYLTMKTTSHNYVHIISLITLFFLLLPELKCQVAAQSDYSSSPPSLCPRFRQSLGIIVAVIITSLFCMVIFFFYRHHCNDSLSAVIPTVNHLGVTSLTRPNRGLDRSILEKFPSFTYWEVKEHKLVSIGALECAVCLNEFEDHEMLRLLPKCEHVFHPKCIGAWLEFHVTCPICRSNLVPKPGEPVRVLEKSSILRNDEVMIQIDDIGNRRQERLAMMNRNMSAHYPNRSMGKKSDQNKFRSYSTGHTSVKLGENLERFTLRLPTDAKKEGMDRAMLNISRSDPTRLTREGSSRKGYRTGNGEGTDCGPGGSTRLIGPTAK